MTAPTHGAVLDVEACGGCGESNPAHRCVGCLHDFAPRTKAEPELEDLPCPICLVPFRPDDLCATDITEGTCHAACLEGSPVVNLDTGEPFDGPVATYRYDSLARPTPDWMAVTQAAWDENNATPPAQPEPGAGELDKFWVPRSRHTQAQAKIARLEREVATWCREAKMLSGANENWRERALSAEADAAKAREALTDVLNTSGARPIKGYHPIDYSRAVDRAETYLATQTERRA